MLRKFLVCAALAVAIAVGLRTGDGLQAQSVAPHRNASLALGNPSNAKTDATMKTNYLLKRTTNDKYPGKTYSPELYSISYNSDTGCPNWAAWHLSSAWLGGAPRQDDFRADSGANGLPSTFVRVAGTWYAGTGFERGHLCPSEDRSTTIEENSATFFMDNMIPQAPNLNAPCWSALEQYCRDKAAAGYEMYIVAGGYNYGGGGTGSSGFDTAFPNSGTNLNKVKVPTHCWKVILFLPNGTGDIGRVTANTVTCAVWVPNDQALTNTSNWQQFRVTVDFVEQQTGYNFHRDVSDAIEAGFESQMYPLP